MTEISTEGVNFGNVELIGDSGDKKRLVLRSVNNQKELVSIDLSKAAQCVVPTMQKDDIEFQFVEQKLPKDEDGLVSMTLHMPKPEEGKDETEAEELQKKVLDTGLIKSVSGNAIAEFTKEQGNFLTPRGRYAIKLTETYFHLVGSQYAYKIKYDDIEALFLLPKPDGARYAFVIALEKPIRQGNQKYPHLVIETHNVESTMDINCSPEELAKYEGLSYTMTLPLSTLLAKCFKIISMKKVFVPKQYQSARSTSSLRCIVRANDGLLYPLAKSFIFIHKPTIIISFDDIESVEFKRYDTDTKTSLTRNFDFVVNLKSDDGKAQHIFQSIDRTEYPSLSDYVSSKGINVINAPVQQVMMDLGDDDDDDDSYGTQESDASQGEDDDDDDEDGGDSDASGDKVISKPKKKKAKKG